MRDGAFQGLSLMLYSPSKHARIPLKELPLQVATVCASPQDSWEVVQQWGAAGAGKAGAAAVEDAAVVACLSFWDYSLVAQVCGSNASKLYTRKS